MLIIKDLNLDQKLSVGIALSFSSDVLPLFEAKFPDDLRPRKATESAIKWLSNPSKEARAAAFAAADAANAGFAAVYAADAGYAVAYAAASAAYAGYAAGSAAHATYAAATYAANAYVGVGADADKKRYIHDRIVKLLPLILEYKIENERPFKNSEKVLKYLKD